MKKKMFGLLVLMFSVFALAACSSNKLDGEYYWIIKDGGRLMMTISGTGGSVDEDGQDFAIVAVDHENGQITVSTDFGEKTYNLNYQDGKVDAPGYGEYYKKGSKAYDEIMKEYGLNESDLEE